VERTTIAEETEELGENLPQRHFVPTQIPHDQVRFRTPDRSGGSEPRSGHVGFVVDKVALGKVSPANLYFTNCSTITIIYHLRLVQ
jgi:hypothetical protein